ncbi:MAG: hypothetical protein WHT82_05345 [Limisphaera sp.]
MSGLIALGLVAALPLLFLGFPPRGHDSIHHARWCSNFASQVWSGEPYPRWLSQVNFGFGSPAFFYYPPLGHWVAAALCPLFAGPRQVWMSLGWAAALALLLSGVTAWVCFSKMARPGRAWLASALYMLGPYHLALGLYERAAYAEFWTYVWMPLIVRGIWGFRGKEPSAWGWAITGFTGLFLSHLPTTVTFTPLALLLALGHGWAALGRTLLALTGAVMLAAVYLLPCFAYLGFVNTGSMRGGLHETFFFSNLSPTQPLAVPDAFSIRVFMVFLGFLLTLLCHHLRWLSSWASRDRPAAAPHWLWLGWLVTFLMLPLSRPIYSALWPLQMIQFTWRFLAPASLIWAALIANGRGDPREPRLGRVCDGVGLLSALVTLVLVSGGVISDTASQYARGPSHPPEPLRTLLDAREYLPGLASPWAARDAMGDRLVVPRSSEAAVSIQGWKARHLQFTVNTPGATTLWVRQLYYPGWRAWRDNTLELKVDGSGPGGAIAVELPPGNYRVDLRLTALLPERLGGWISFFTLAGLAFLAIGRVRLKSPEFQTHSGAQPTGGPSSPCQPV